MGAHRKLAKAWYRRLCAQLRDRWYCVLIFACIYVVYWFVIMNTFSPGSQARTALLQIRLSGSSQAEEQPHAVPVVQSEAEVKPEHLPVWGDEAAPVPNLSEPTWVFCAGQWQECICWGDVRWGNKDRWHVLKPKKGETLLRVKCSIETLPDVRPGDGGKHCECLFAPGAQQLASLNPGLLPVGTPYQNSRAPLSAASCEQFARGAQEGAAGSLLWQAMGGLCSQQLPPDANKPGPKAMDLETTKRLFSAWVAPGFERNYHRLYNASGWIPRAFVNYYAGVLRGKHARMTEELINSVHLFSSEPIVVVHYGFMVEGLWTADRFPRLVLLNAAPIPPGAERSFHFNKFRAMLMARALVGIELDSDQFVAPGIDNMFTRTEQEVTQEYSMPILPAHFWPFSPKDQNLGGGALWKRFCPSTDDCRFQTSRWGHAHPTWTFWALPFLGGWLRRNFRDEWLPERQDGQMKSLRVIEVTEDEDLLNVGTWEAGGTKQWCKFDLPDATEFRTLLDHSKGDVCTKGMCGNIQGDPRFHPHEIAKVFYTAHHAVDPDASHNFVQSLAARFAAGTLPPPILYQGHFYKDGAELKRAHPSLTCLI